MKATLALRANASLDLRELREAHEKSSGDLDVKFQLAQALAGAEDFRPALELCLELLELDRKGLGEQGRELMIQIFRVLPDGDSLTTEYRRKLSMALY